MSLPNIKRFLITTPDETTWNHENPLLFLGEWCRLFSEREHLEQLDIQQHPYHWSDRKKFADDYLILGKIYEEKLAALSGSLNSIHGITRDIRYWRIIIGPWLRFFIDSVYDRFELIRTVAELSSVDDTWIHTYQLENWIPTDFQEFYMQFRHDGWNHIIFSECIKALNIPFTQKDTQLIPSTIIKTKQSSLRRLAKIAMNTYNAVLPSRFNRVAIVAGYIPIGKLIKLQRSLGQLPSYISSPSVSVDNRTVDHVKRNLLFAGKADSGFEKLLNRLIVQLIPFAYVENFAALQKKSIAAFPSNPKLIFTANAYQADDGFKVWAAGHVLNRVPLVIGQHGGHFGIGLLNQMEDHQVKIADVFATWGWTDEKNKNIIPLPAMKLNAGTVNYKSDGDILLTTASYPRYFYCYFSVTVAGQFPDYMQQQIRFSKLLDRAIIGSLKIRTDTDIFGWEIHERLKAAGLEQSIDHVKADLLTRLKDCRISVSTYNATVFLETLVTNFPTLVFFDPEKYEIRAEAKQGMDSLRKVGILHDTPESAAAFLNEVGSDISAWWNSKAVQETRQQFCITYANTSENWIDVWKDFLKDMIKSSLTVKNRKSA